MKARIFASAATVLALLAVTAGFSADESLLTLDRILVDKDFETEKSPSLRWLDDGSHYTTLEKTEAYPDSREIVRHRAAERSRNSLFGVAWCCAANCLARGT